eukprot:ANDGO_07866.mRNA.1 hypothetical protein
MGGVVEFTSYPVFRFSRRNQVFSRLLVLSIQDILVIDPFSGNVKTRDAMENVKKVSWDQRNPQLFRIVFQNDEAHIYLSADSEKIVANVVRNLKLLHHKGGLSKDQLPAPTSPSPSTSGSAGVGGGSRSKSSELSAEWSVFCKSMPSCDYSFLVQGVDSKGHLHSHELVVAGRLVRHVDQEKKAMFSQHSYDDIAFFRVDRRDRLLMTIEYKNDRPYRFIVSAKDRHLLLAVFTGRLYLFQNVLQFLAENKIPFADVDDAGIVATASSAAANEDARDTATTEYLFQSSRTSSSAATPVVRIVEPSKTQFTDQLVESVTIDPSQAEHQQFAMQRVSGSDNGQPALSHAGNEDAAGQFSIELVWQELQKPLLLYKHIRKGFSKKNARLATKPPHQRAFMADATGFVYWGEPGATVFPNCLRATAVRTDPDIIREYKGMSEDNRRLSFAVETEAGETLYLIAPDDDAYFVWTTGLAELILALEKRNQDFQKRQSWAHLTSVVSTEEQQSLQSQIEQHDQPAASTSPSAPDYQPLQQRRASIAASSGADVNTSRRARVPAGTDI